LKQRGFLQVGNHHSRIFDKPSPVNGSNVSEWIILTTIRNHYDTMVSWAAQNVPTSQKEFLTLTAPELERVSSKESKYIRPHSLWWMHLPHTTEVLRFESLNQDLSRVLGCEVELPVSNVSKRRGGRHYREFYTPEARAYVAGRFKEEMEECGYGW
jgi:hypothetical protein